MQNSKEDKNLSPADIAQLLAAVSDLNQSVTHLSKLLQHSLRAQIRSESKNEQPAAPRKILH